MARVALFLNPGADLAQAVDVARRADALGYDSVWTTHGVGRDALLVLSAYGAVAPRVGLGTGVIPIYPRHPVALAQQALTLADITGGRLHLGIGVSHRPPWPTRSASTWAARSTSCASTSPCCAARSAARPTTRARPTA
jgi:alkanesulfonate monooxygenase SsuD/methylene tetrahydromethanopterin reductase-like flavin-dependent oxidoreductase (luciferase family)